MWRSRPEARLPLAISISESGYPRGAGSGGSGLPRSSEQRDDAKPQSERQHDHTGGSQELNDAPMSPLGTDAMPFYCDHLAYLLAAACLPTGLFTLAAQDSLVRRAARLQSLPSEPSQQRRKILAIVDQAHLAATILRRVT